MQISQDISLYDDAKQIESGKKRGSVTVLCRAATVLNVDLDMLVTDWESHENKPA